MSNCPAIGAVFPNSNIKTANGDAVQPECVAVFSLGRGIPYVAGNPAKKGARRDIEPIGRIEWNRKTGRWPACGNRS